MVTGADDNNNNIEVSVLRNVTTYYECDFLVPTGFRIIILFFSVARAVSCLMHSCC